MAFSQEEGVKYFQVFVIHNGNTKYKAAQYTVMKKQRQRLAHRPDADHSVHQKTASTPRNPVFTSHCRRTLTLSVLSHGH